MSKVTDLDLNNESKELLSDINNKLDNVLTNKSEEQEMDLGPLYYGNSNVILALSEEDQTSSDESDTNNNIKKEKQKREYSKQQKYDFQCYKELIEHWKDRFSTTEDQYERVEYLKLIEELYEKHKGYYVPYPMVRSPIGSQFPLTPNPDFPAIVKSRLASFTNMDFFYYFHIKISSLIGIAEHQKFYQPYQIWTIKTMFGGTNLSSVNEDKDHLSKNIDMCYNNFSHYQVQAGIDLMLKAQYLLQHNTYVLWMDGRRILAYDTERPHHEGMKNPYSY
ncbi:hypothetical protein J1N35_007852 [Gossypium stocksii]|uniref:Uncharacterized protein n=1 Tax=Gossypium stocksii TaxID=47602 RepID=A0A9D3W6U1_9ROSI|nr:hypothetical protein J1N35_007852 [Gossypium stocksii]